LANINKTVKKSYLSGVVYGLSLKYYTSFHEDLDELMSFWDRFGVNIKIENGSYSLDSNNGFEVQRGVKTSVSIERVYKYKLPNPYSECDYDESSMGDLDLNIKNREIFNLIRKSEYGYERQLCVGK
jgi:hypothetical protein